MAETKARGAEFVNLGFKHRSEMGSHFSEYRRHIGRDSGFVAYSAMEAKTLASMTSEALGVCPGWGYGLASCDDSHDVTESWPALSRMGNDRYAVGSLAAEMLVQALKGHPSPSLTIRGNWIEGSSSKRLPIGA